MEANLKLKIRAWIQAGRPPFYIATFIPLAIGWILGKQQCGSWHPERFFFIALGSFLIHLATNLANDVFDHLQGTDDGDSIGGSRVIQEGALSFTAVKNAMIGCYASACLIGLYAMSVWNLWGLLPLMAVALFSSIFYVAPPVRYGYHGLGEVSVAVNMGPVMVLGTSWVISENPSWLPVIVSIPVGLMVASILYYQSLPDMKTDAAAGKRTLAVRLGKKWACRGLIFQWIAVYGSIILLTASGTVSRISLISLATLPLLIKITRLIRQTHDWVELDTHGKYVRILYLINGLIIIAGLLKKQL
ncbi:MAG: 1,4-dihydroxy-2-naphthoate octaprenyltransferase [Desulfobacterales bacterium]|nr:1,4-dihydroxy-2-naphthoate octaprenyltransferase [Desulfobacterales bacterium]MDD4393139.1 1,4-dihydroxy-2-naphthoate octaprenyltransferase [Desulfobacterales bacterium]